MTIALGGANFSRKDNTLVVCCNVAGDREEERKAPFDRMNKSGNDFRYFLLLLSRKKEGKRMAGARVGVGSDPKVRALNLTKNYFWKKQPQFNPQKTPEKHSILFTYGFSTRTWTRPEKVEHESIPSLEP